MSTLVHLDSATIGVGDRPLVQTGSFAVHRGERIALQGRSGSGKSLTLAALAGRLPPPLTLQPPTARHASQELRIGLIPQRGHDALHPLYPIGRQLMAVTGRSRDQVGQVLDRAGLDPGTLWGRRPAELSGGQAQRVAIALASLATPDLILADEPTSALDDETRNETLELIERVLMSDRQPALVIATHDSAVPALLHARVVPVTDGVVGRPGDDTDHADLDDADSPHDRDDADDTDIPHYRDDTDNPGGRARQLDGTARQPDETSGRPDNTAGQRVAS